MAASIVLHSSDSKEFSVERNVIALSKTLNTMIRDLGLEDMDTPMPIPLPNVDSSTLEKVLEWCRQHKDDEILEAPRDPKVKECTVPEWDTTFLKENEALQYEIIKAANYLDIPTLLDFTCQTMAEKFKGKTEAELREIFAVENDFTPEEYAKVCKDAEWCED